MHIVSLLPAAAEIVGVLGQLDRLAGVSHECDFPPEVNAKPRVTHCPIHEAGLPSAEIDRWVRETLASTGTLYSLDEPLLRRLEPDAILTQRLCDVCRQVRLGPGVRRHPSQPPASRDPGAVVPCRHL